MILLLHGIYASSLMWEPLTEALEERNMDYISYDLPSHAKEIDIDMRSIDNITTYIKQTLEEDRIDPDIVIGHSFGGVIAQRFAQRYQPQKLILMSTSARTPPELNIIQDFQHMLKRRGLKGYANLLKTSLRGTEKSEMARMLLADPKVYAQYKKYRENLTFDYTISNRSIRSETLIIYGEDDLVIPLEEAKILRDSIPFSTLRVIPRCGHIPSFERPNLTIPLILDFCYL